jgi:hypothetical protein
MTSAMIHDETTMIKNKQSNDTKPQEQRNKKVEQRNKTGRTKKQNR